MTRSLFIGVTALLLASCQQGGSFCRVYIPVDMTRAGAVAIVAADRPAAERIAVNEESAGECGR